MSFNESRKSMLTAVSAVLLVTACSQEGAEPTATEPAAEPAAATAAANDASAVDSAMAALGMENLDSITYSGTAWRIRNSFMQTPSASPPWPLRDTITNYTRTINLANVGQPVSLAKGETFAQNLFFAPAVAGTYTQYIPGDPTPAWGQQLEVWLTPWGFLKGADAYEATEASQTLENNPVTAVTWMSPATQTSPSGMRYTVTGYINAQNEVERVETWVQDPFLGDMHVVALYSDYMDFNGLMVPATMEQQRGGGGIFGVNVTAASANPANVAELLTPPAPPTPPAAPPPAAAPPAELSQEVGEGVYYITGGYGALAVEFADHIAVFEAGQSEARGQQILDEVKRLFPDKPIRFLINSHPHSDHTAGMVPFVREGATIVTHANNVAFLNMALSTPRTLLGEPTLMPVFQAAEGMTVLEDATNRIELHHIPNDHSDGMLVGYLPMQKILFQADFTLPQGGAAPNPFVVKLAEYVDMQGLDFESYLAVHAAQMPQTKADLMATIGK
jgi:glyoxylase-like metal-dependent hydrolase (beta-lactamase superfamily II)